MSEVPLHEQYTYRHRMGSGTALNSNSLLGRLLLAGSQSRAAQQRLFVLSRQVSLFFTQGANVLHPGLNGAEVDRRGWCHWKGAVAWARESVRVKSPVAQQDLADRRLHSCGSARGHGEEGGRVRLSLEVAEGGQRRTTTEENISSSGVQRLGWAPF